MARCRLVADRPGRDRGSTTPAPLLGRLTMSHQVGGHQKTTAVLLVERGPRRRVGRVARIAADGGVADERPDLALVDAPLVVRLAHLAEQGDHRGDHRRREAGTKTADPAILRTDLRDAGRLRAARLAALRLALDDTSKRPTSGSSRSARTWCCWGCCQDFVGGVAGQATRRGRRCPRRCC